MCTLVLASGPLSFVFGLALVPAPSAGWECAKTTMSDWDIDPNPDGGYKSEVKNKNHYIPLL